MLSICCLEPHPVGLPLWKDFVLKNWRRPIELLNTVKALRASQIYLKSKEPNFLMCELFYFLYMVYTLIVIER